MTSEVLHNHEEATYITVETVSFYGVKAEPENVTVNSQEASFTYRDNQVIYFNIVFQEAAGYKYSDDCAYFIIR